MATAGASAMAGVCGLHGGAVALLVVAVLDALRVLVIGALRHRSEFGSGWRAWWAIGPPDEHAGIHTVPLGLAMTVSGQIGLGFGAGMASGWIFAELALVWSLSVVCLGRFLWSVAAHGWRLETMDGAWFLVPAVLLGAAVATHTVAASPGLPADNLLAVLVRGGALVGTIGYWAVAAVAATRLWRYGLDGVPRAPWFIAMGCAGLAAGALGLALRGPHALSDALGCVFAVTMAVTEIAAVALCVPIVAGSIGFLLRRCRFAGPAAWPPTFSTAVFGLGGLQTGAVLQSRIFATIGLCAASATVLFWLVTATWNAARRLRRPLPPSR